MGNSVVIPDINIVRVIKAVGVVIDCISRHLTILSAFAVVEGGTESGRLTLLVGE